MDTVRRRITLPVVGALVAGACIGAGGGAATYAALSSGDSKTVVRQVTVPESQPAANTSAPSVHTIYELARTGVVKISVSTSGTPLGGSSQAQGSGFVY